MLTLSTVVVTFNRKDLLLNNIKKQFEQTYKPNHLIIVDNNSSDGTYEFLKENGIIDLPTICYFNTGENIGGAGGFSFGIKKAYEIGDDLICLMDDDGYPIDSECFENAISILPFSSPNLSIPIFVNSLVKKDDDNLTFPYDGEISTVADAIKKSKNGFLSGCGSPFNGTFINRELVDLIGYPRADFFIRYDELDYYLKAKKCNAFVGVAVHSCYFHPSTSEYCKKIFFGINFVNEYEAAWKEYYKIRNFTVLKRDLGSSRIKLFLAFKKYLFGVNLFDIDDKKNVKKFIKRGFKDAMNNNMGKTITPGQKVL